MRVLWTWAGVAALALGVIVWGLIFWAASATASSDDELPRQTKYNLPSRSSASIVPFLVIAGLFYRTVVVEDDVNKLSQEPRRQVQVDAFKWNWQFEYHYLPRPADRRRPRPRPTQTTGDQQLARCT